MRKQQYDIWLQKRRENSTNDHYLKIGFPEIPAKFFDL